MESLLNVKVFHADHVEQYLEEMPTISSCMFTLIQRHIGLFEKLNGRAIADGGSDTDRNMASFFRPCMLVDVNN